MTLSIITINYNNLAGLKQTIESVLTQTYSDFEFIVIDGGSNDGSYEELKRQTSNINYWVSEKDDGVYHAMNKGIKIAMGEYLLFLNSGDYFKSNDVIAKFIGQEHDADIVAGVCTITRNNHIVHKTSPSAFITFGDLYFTGLNHQSTFIKKDLFAQNGMYREDFKYHGDIEFWYRSIILGGATTANTNIEVCYYNLEGVSEKNKEQIDFIEEHNLIFHNPILQRILPDYIVKQQKAESEQVWQWVKSKKVLYDLNTCIFMVAKWFLLLKSKFSGN
jgi:glycosyltransferase involved in cell wall biosynthesis